MARASRFSIPTRIFLGFAVALGAFAAVAVASVVQHERTTRTLRLLHEGYLPLALTVGEARTNQQVFTTLLDRVLQEQDTTATRSWLASARRVRPGTLRRAMEDLERTEQLEPPPEDRRTIERVRNELEEVRKAYGESEAQYNELFHALEQGNNLRAESILSDLRSRERSIHRHFREAANLMQERIAATSSRAADQERQAAILLGLLTLVAIAAGVAVTWWSHRILKPLPLLHERVQAVARGDLSRRLEPRSDDELGRLTREFERMVEALAARDARLRDAAEAQRRLQRMQEQIVASLSAAVVVVDGTGVVRTVNPAAETVLALGEAWVGRELDESGLKDRLPGLAQAMARVAGGEPQAALEASKFQGTERYVNLLVTPFGVEEDDDGRRAVLIVAEDVTEELETKARLIHTERLAAIGKMAAHVTHEVRNPLSSIGLNVEMLEEELVDAGTEGQSLLYAIRKEIDRLTAITEEYLRLARTPEPSLEPDDVGELARSAAEFVRPEMETSGVNLDLQIEQDLPPVAMDEPQLRQALLNLLRNAREAMSEGGRVMVGAHRANDGGVVVVVQDEGPGIPYEARERLFDLFYTTKERGTGLGLPLTQQIVVAHAGRIRCEGDAGQGTRFELWFPPVQASESIGRTDVIADGEAERRTV